MSIALITGGSGHVGANLVRELIAQDYKVRCIDFDGDHRAFEGFDVELIKGSVTDVDSLDKAFEGADVVFHTAAIISLERKNKDLIRSVNNLLRHPSHFRDMNSKTMLAPSLYQFS